MNRLAITSLFFVLSTASFCQSPNNIRAKADEWKHAHYARQDAIVKLESWTRIPDGHGWFRLRTKEEIAVAIAKDQPQIDALDTNYRTALAPALKRLKIKLASGYQPDDVRKALVGK